MAVATVTKGATVMAAGGTTLNSLITGVTFEEIILISLGALMKTLSLMAILGL